MNKLLIASAGIIAVIILALAVLVYLPQHRDGAAPTAELIADNGNVTLISLEIADTPAEQKTGLMNRSSLAGDTGMLFVFDSDERQSFWMKNTLISLDMIFIASDLTIIDIHENATPLSENSIVSSGPCRYVLEVNGGLCREKGIVTGSHVRLNLD